MLVNQQHTWVICAYGESEYLDACIQSLKKQTLQSQIICYSSTPLDSIKELCQRYDIPFYTKQGGGIGKDWNNALSFVETKYATIAHQDDYYEPEYAEKVLAKMEKHPDVLIAYSDYFEEKDGHKIPANTNLKNFFFDEGMRVSLDWYAWYKISEYKGRFAYVSDKLMCHRIHGESETSKTIADNTRSKEDLYMYELFWPKWIAKLLMRQYVKSQNSNK